MLISFFDINIERKITWIGTMFDFSTTLLVSDVITRVRRLHTNPALYPAFKNQIKDVESNGGQGVDSRDLVDGLENQPLVKHRRQMHVFIAPVVSFGFSLIRRLMSMFL